MGFLPLGVLLLAFTSHMKLQNKGRRFDKSKESQPWYPRCIIQFKCYMQNHQSVKNKARAWLSRDSMGFCYNVAGYVFGLSLIECFFFSFSVCIVSVTLLVLLLWWYGFPGVTLDHWHLPMGFFQLCVLLLVFTSHMKLTKNRSAIWQKQRI